VKERYKGRDDNKVDLKRFLDDPKEKRRFRILNEQVKIALSVQHSLEETMDLS